jgi:C1A family cysteine protease
MRYYGWVRDLPDHRDKLFSATYQGALPSMVDLRPDMPPIYDQGQASSCTGNAYAAAHDYLRNMQGLPFINPSRLMAYYNARVLEGSVGWDNGARIRDVVKGAATFGVCPETAWPYDISKITVTPSDAAFASGVKDKLVGFRSVAQDINIMRACLAERNPIIFGFSVYQSFEEGDVATTGIMQMPLTGERVVGGHCVLGVTYDDSINKIICRNSWGTDWGMPESPGHFGMPYDFISSPQYASDFWTPRLVTDTEPSPGATQ